MNNSFVPSNQTPTAYGYGRVSHVDQFKKNDSIPSQEVRIERYYDHVLKPDGVRWGGFVHDNKNVSAYKIMFESRPAGKKLLTTMVPGDHIVVDKVDRFWRSLEDFVMLMRLFRQRNITVHIVNFLGQSICSNTAMGDFILKQFVLIGELESTIKSERTREALAVIRSRGLRSNRLIPPGCRLKKSRIRRNNGTLKSELVWCPKQRTLMREIARLLDDEKLMWKEALPWIEAAAAALEDRPIRDEKDKGYIHDRKDGWPRMYKYECAYKYLNILEPSQIPKKAIILEAARQYKRERTIERGKQGGYVVKDVVAYVSPEDLLSTG